MKKTKPETREERKLKGDIAQLQVDLAISQFTAAENKGAALHLGKQLDYTAHRAEVAEVKGAALQRLNHELETTNRLAAEGLMIERDELLVRVRRLGMRIQGLGFNL